jgi:cytoskeleton protein RodZ
MNELGLLLRETRESKEISLAEAEARTRIRQKFIAAMEAEDWNTLPGEVATRGFLRNYSAYLGLDEARVFQLYQSRAKPAAPAPMPVPSSERPVDYRPIEMDLSSQPARRIPWRWIVVAAILVLVGLGAWWLFAYRPAWVGNLFAMPRSLPNPADIVALEPTSTPTATAEIVRVTATFTATPLPVATPAATRAAASATAAPSATPQASETAASTPESPTPIAAITPTTASNTFAPAERIALRIDVATRSWLRLLVDGKVAQETVLEPGASSEWEALQSIVLRTGNGSGVVLTLNGQQLPPLGGPGAVVELRWDLVDGEIIQSTPSPTPSPPALEAPPAETPAE